MDRYKETQETWNKIAALYQDKFMDLDLYNHTYDVICNTLKHGANILEIGCGPGNITRYLLTKRPDFQILGIDIAPNMIALAEQNNPQARFKVMDCRNILELETTFDGIICGYCLPFLSPPDVNHFFHDVHQSLTRKGLLYLSFVEGDSKNSGYKVSSSGDRVYFYYHDMYTLENLFRDNQFEKSNHFHLNYNNSEGKTDIHTVCILTKNS